MAAVLAEHREDTDFKEIEKILSEEVYQFPKSRPGDLEKLRGILSDNSVVLLYPVLARGKQKIPFICFQMKLEEELLVESYLIQKEALRIVISEIIGCEIPDVEILVKDFELFSKSLTEFKCQEPSGVVKLIEEQLAGRFKDSGFQTLNSFKDYQKWAVTEEIIVTLESFGDMMFPVFQDEIREVRYHCGKESQPLLEQYLFGGSGRMQADLQPLHFYYGSYAGGFSVNFKQSKVAAAYRDSRLLAVNGPPGTGKTTVLKEIIADNLVRKTEKLVENWNVPWNSLGTGKQQVYCSPLGGACDYSMVISSYNNMAVDNIGFDLLKEISYFPELAVQAEKSYRWKQFKRVTEAV